MTQLHRARQYAATHQRIYGTAIGLFQEHGYEEVSIGQVAAAAGVSVPTFYAHYAGKDELLMAPLDPAEVAALVAQVPDDLPLRDRLRSVLQHFLRGVARERESDALARWQLIAATPRLRYRAAEYERATAQLFLDALGERVREDPAARVVVAAHLTAFTEALLRWAQSGGRLPLAEVAEEALTALRDL